MVLGCSPDIVPFFSFLVNFPPTQKYASRSLRKIYNTFTTPLILFGSGNAPFILFYG